MRSARLERLVWPGMILAGVVLAAIIWAIWPVGVCPRGAAHGPARHLRAAPVPSELELLEGYEQESPEELGAEPLPGAALTPGPPPVAD